MAQTIQLEIKRLIRSEQRFIGSFDADDDMGACMHDRYTKCRRHKDDWLI